jgi:hypothetical protein
MIKKTFQTNVGFDFDEIKQTSTDDLVSMKESIAFYFSSKKRKIKNFNYRDLYERINAELEVRKKVEEEKTKEEREKLETERGETPIFNFVFPKIQPVKPIENFGFNFPPKQVDTFGLNIIQKQSETLSLDFPSFLNDKSNEKLLGKKTEKEKKPRKKRTPKAISESAKKQMQKLDPNQTLRILTHQQELPNRIKFDIPQLKPIIQTAPLVNMSNKDIKKSNKSPEQDFEHNSTQSHSSFEAMSCWEYMLNHTMSSYKNTFIDQDNYTDMNTNNIFKTDFQICEYENFVDETLFKQPY